MTSRSYWALCVCCLFFCQGSFADALSLWRIDQEYATVFLLGSIHALKPEHYPLAPEIERAFNQSDKTVFEVDLARLSAKKMAVLLKQYGMYDPPQSIETELSPKTWNLLLDYLQQNALEPEDFKQMRPWRVALGIGMIELGNLGYRLDLGIDVYFQDKARKLGKPIIQMESFASQVELMAGDSPEVQEISLRLTLESLQGLPGEIDDLILAWQQGAAERMYDLSIQPGEYDSALTGQMERLLDQRNLEMAEKISTYLHSDASYFVVIGALHMGGPKGILALLSKDYIITQQHRSGTLR